MLNQATPDLPDGTTPIAQSPWESNSIPSRTPSISPPLASAPLPEAPVLKLALDLALERSGEGNSHAALQAVAARLSGNSAGKGAESADSRCLCPVCSQLEVINANLETLEAPGAEPAAAGTSSSITLASSLDLGKTFFLHSNPTANHTIYLDFDGHSMASSQWENGGALQLRPFYSDFSSSTTLLEIQRIWQRMVEDFAPFNVNVTTQEPNTEDLRKSGTGDSRWGLRMAFTYNTNLATGNPITNAGGGGTAYYNSFNWSTDDVALGFNRGEYAAAETGSHEVGHAINLRHDGGTYGSNATYYEGHGGTGPTSWGTIMGAAFIGNRENLTTWSKGEYIGANNTQDDLYTITNGNGFSYRADDHGNSAATATLLQGVSFSQFGIIERNTDIDWFRFDTGSGNVTLNITNASRVFVADGLGGYTTEYLTARGPNLDISASLYHSDGTWISTSNPLDQITASFSNLYLEAGSYYLAVDGVGVGDPYSNPPSGYTDYASLGQYMVNGTVQPTVQPPALVLSQTDNLFTSESGSTASFSVRLSQAPSANVTVALASSNSAEGTVSPASLTFTSANWATAQWVTVTGVDDWLVDGPQTYTVSLSASSSDAGFNGLSGPLVSVINADNDVAQRIVFTASTGNLQNNLTYTSGGSPLVSATGEAALAAVAGSDDSRLSISEGTILVTSGKGKNATQSPTSALDAYGWSFEVVNADRFVFEGYRTANSESDGFRFELSTDGGGSWSTLLTVNGTGGDLSQSVNLATPFTGTALVRVVDTNRSAGTSVIDTLHIDRLAFEGLVTDLRPSLSVAASTAQAVEDTAAAGVFTVSRSGGTEALTLAFSLGGTATYGSDYTLVDGNGNAIGGSSITLAAGQSSTVVQVVPINDSTPEPAETVIFSLQEPSSAYKLGTASATVSIVDTLQPSGPFLSSSDLAKSGTVSGSHTATWAADGQSQVLTEVLSGGSPKNRTSLLEHHWSFDVVTGAREFRLSASASGGEGEAFNFSYSTNGGSSWTSLGSISGTTAASGVSWSLGNDPINNPIDGPVLVRVVDSDRSAGLTSFDSLSIDAMGFYPTATSPSLTAATDPLTPWLTPTPPLA
ncbi:MAG: hypothetical protein R6W06_02140 [Prochlorococcaceae cyanobacterium]